MYHGTCLCAGIRFEIDGEFAPIDICHCTQCRKAQGTPFATNSPVPRASFRIVAGRELLSFFESSPGKKRWFCQRCGSPIYSERESLPDIVRIRMGLIEEPVKARPIAHFHLSAATNWWQITDRLPQFAEGQMSPAQGDVLTAFDRAREHIRDVERKALRKLGDRSDDDDDGGETRH